jgi:hypothetical protein
MAVDDQPRKKCCNELKTWRSNEDGVASYVIKKHHHKRDFECIHRTEDVMRTVLERNEVLQGRASRLCCFHVSACEVINIAKGCAVFPQESFLQSDRHFLSELRLRKR